MPDLVIRDFTDEEIAAIKKIASPQSMQQWGREYILAALHAPVIERRYAIRAYDTNGASVIIRRLEDDMSHEFNQHMSDNQRQAAEIAIGLVKRNGAGDREEALSVLKSAFVAPEGFVFETLM